MFNKTRKADDLRAISVPKFDFSTKYYPKIAVIYIPVVKPFHPP